MSKIMQRRYRINLGLGSSALLLMVAFQNFSTTPTTSSLGGWPMVVIDFNQNNILSTETLIDPVTNTIIKTEPLDPRATGETGPANVAIGRPQFFKDQASVMGAPDISATVAPGTQYTVGFQSECLKVPDLERCARDNAFYIRLDPNSRDKTKDNSIQDKAFFRTVQVDHPKALAMTPDDPLIRYFSYDLKFDRYYERSKTWTMHMQAFQQGQGGGPALSMRMIRTLDSKTSPAQQELEMSLIALNDRVFATTEPPGSPSAIKHQGNFGVIDICPTTSLKFVREQWYNITLKMAPSSVVGTNGKEKGEIALYINGELKCRYTGNWGFKPVDPAFPIPTMAIDVGVYRARTDVQQMISVDNVKYGPTLRSVWDTGRSRVTLPAP